MRTLRLGELARAAGCEVVRGDPDHAVAGVCTDTRRLIPARSVFFALQGRQSDGHRYVVEAWARGCEAAVVDASQVGELPPDGALLAAPPVANGGDPVLATLVRLATWWRRQLGARVLAITGSNGKTTVKSALHPLLARRYRLAVSPGSYNSRLGVALSLLGMDEGIDLAVVEAGISEPGDMAPLQAMIQPDLGLLTGIGLAHLGSFGSRERIGEEKIQLFAEIDPSTGWVLIPDEPLCQKLARRLSCPVHPFGVARAQNGLPGLSRRSTTQRLGQVVRLTFPTGEQHDIEILDTSTAQVQNIAAAAAVGVLLDVEPADIADALDRFRPPPQRMETWQTPDGVTVINDCYSADPTSTDAALRALGAYPAGQRKVFVFGGMAGLGPRSDDEHRHVGRLAAQMGVTLFGAVGNLPEPAARAFGEQARGAQVLSFADREQAAARLATRLDHGDVVLVKGPTRKRLDGLARALVESSAATRLFINLTAVEENLRRLRQHLGSTVRFCPIVKAAAYGGDPVRLCRFLERIGVDALGVALTDEGVTLRKAGIALPLLVLTPSRGEATRLVRYGLTPVVHSHDILSELEQAAARQDRAVDVHVKMDTGMGRYGFFPDEVLPVLQRIQGHTRLRVEGLMTHFAVAEDPSEDEFTREQMKRFDHVIAAIRDAGLGVPLCHAAATAAAIRFPEARYDMVRIGLGMYGVAPSEACHEQLSLDYAFAVVSRIAAIKTFPAGHTIGYGRRYRVSRDGERIAFIPCGYHDAVWRSLYRGGGEVIVRGVRCPIVGTISMDSAPIDVSHVPEADIGDDVLLFGEWQGQVLPPEEVARRAGTVAHELLSGIGPRVQRIYLEG